MAFTTIDDGAWTTTDDGPLASCHSVTLRNNAAACSDERVPTTAIVFPADEPLRLCSYFTTCVGPFFIYLPPSEDFESLSVYVQVADVELGGESAGYRSAYLYATIGTVGRSYIDKPPTRLDPPVRPDWVGLDKGEDGPFQVPDGTIPVANANKPTGWVPVFIWIRSVEESSAQYSGTITASTSNDNSVQLDPDDSMSISTPPERLFVVQPRVNATTQDPFGSDVYQWCAYRDDDSEEWAELAPLLPASGYTIGASSAASWDSYRLGVVLISAITITATPATFEPSEAGYYSAVPAAEQWLNLINRVNRLINERTPQWCCNPGPDSYSDGSHSRLWPLRAGDAYGYAGGDPLDTSYQTLMRALVVTEPPNDNGYDAIISFVFMRRWVADGTAAFPGKITLRLVAYAAGVDSPGSAYGSGEEFVIEATELERSVPNYAEAFTQPEYSPARHAIARASDVVDWQLRGQLGGHNLRSGTGTHDWALVSNIELPPLLPDGLSYPLRVSVEAKISAEYSVLTTAVVGGAIRSRTIGAE